MADPVFNLTRNNLFGLHFQIGLAHRESFASPTFADIDGDGDLDGFISFYNGETRFFRNIGTLKTPQFENEPGNLGIPIDESGGGISPTFADIDNDGDLDLFIGTITGQTKFFRNVGTANSPNFVSEAKNFGLTDVDIAAKPYFVDIDADGDLDAFIGSDNPLSGAFQNSVQFFRNTGTINTPKFVAETDNFGLNTGYDSLAPTFADIDNDGDQDAFLGTYFGKVIFFRNTGTASTPHFTLQTDNFGILRSETSSIPTLADLDGDGDLDAVVGYASGNTYFYFNTIKPTLTEFSSYITSGNEDTEITITYDQLQKLGNESDIDGTVTGFVIKEVNPGSLLIGLTAETATSWRPGFNDIIDATHKAFWTPDLNSNGIISAFTVSALDNEGGISTSPIAAQINVAPINDQPFFQTPFPISYFDTEYDDTFATTKGVLRTIDIDGNSNSLTYGIIGGVDNGNGSIRKLDTFGVLTVNKTTGAYTFVANDPSIEALATNTNRSFTIVAFDGSMISSTILTIKIFQFGLFFGRTESTGSDSLIGSDVNNKFNSLAGNDTINGLGGNDILIGDLGNDLLDGGDGIDTASYITAAAGVKVNLGIIGQQNTVNAGSDTLMNIERVVGSNFNDTLIGNTADNILLGGLGNDTINGAAGIDTASYVTANAGVTVNLGIALQQNTGSAGFDTLINIERVVGSKFNDTLIGNASDNILLGGLGNDTLSGGGGVDRVSYITATAGVTINLGLSVKQNTLSAGIDVLNGIENLFGSNFDDNLKGNAEANFINGLLGNDTLFGKAGNDILKGDTGADIFVFDTALNPTTNNDKITDFSVVDDTFRLENAIFTKLSLPGTLATENFISGASANALDSNDYLIYDTTNGSLYYDADGSGSAVKIEFVTLIGNPLLTASDIVIV